MDAPFSLALIVEVAVALGVVALLLTRLLFAGEGRSNESAAPLDLGEDAPARAGPI